VSQDRQQFAPKPDFLSLLATANDVNAARFPASVFAGAGRAECGRLLLHFDFIAFGRNNLLLLSLLATRCYEWIAGRQTKTRPA